MIVKCPNCDGALKYDPISKKMVCDYCASFFTPEEVQAKIVDDQLVEQEAASLELNEGLDDADYMECNVYRCRSCGGELMVNGLEASTFCSYCGQPTIVFDRVSKEMKPKYIVPFSVSKDEAIKAIRDKLAQGMFVPIDIKNFETERIRGIYIPYWLCDVDYADRQSLRGTVGSGKSKRTYYYYREAHTSFANMTLDASERLSDETSQRLEPFNTHELKEFNVGYLSGYYADRYDMEPEIIGQQAIMRAKHLFDEEIEKTVKADNVKILRNRPSAQVLDTKYVLLPAWFLTFIYEGEAYTFLVNGQTRKVVGGAPYEKKYVMILITLLGILFGVIASVVMKALLLMEDDDAIEMVAMLVILGVGAFMGGMNKFKKLKQSVELSKSRVMMKFVKDRQKEG